MERIAPLQGQISHSALYVLPHLVERFAPPLKWGACERRFSSRAVGPFHRARRAFGPVVRLERRRSGVLWRGICVFFRSSRWPGARDTAKPGRPSLTRDPDPSRSDTAAMTTFATARRLASSFVAAAATAAAALLATAANAQTTTTLGASYTTTAMESSAALSTTGGLTLNLGLGFEYLIVGGGGGGGGNIGGGGGAGGVLTNVGGTAPAAVLSGGTAGVTVGGGGAGGSTTPWLRWRQLYDLRADSHRRRWRWCLHPGARRTAKPVGPAAPAAAAARRTRVTPPAGAAERSVRGTSAEVRSARAGKSIRPAAAAARRRPARRPPKRSSATAVQASLHRSRFRRHLRGRWRWRHQAAARGDRRHRRWWRCGRGTIRARGPVAGDGAGTDGLGSGGGGGGYDGGSATPMAAPAALVS